MPPRARDRGRGGRGHGRGEPAPKDPPANPDLAAILVEMQTMWADMNALRQAPAGGAPGPLGNSLGANPGGALVVPPECPLDLRDWCRMALEKFDGTGAPIGAADWLSSVVEKLKSFQVPASDCVR
jgi:hypothetical protein